jgi:hypothetical protein
VVLSVISILDPFLKYQLLFARVLPPFNTAFKRAPVVANFYI